MSSESIRERIARVIDKELNGDCGYGVGEHLAGVLLAKLPFLAGVTDEMVEAGARALHDRYNIERGGLRQFDELPPTAQELLRGDARTVLDAALGKEQVDEF